MTAVANAMCRVSAGSEKIGVDLSRRRGSAAASVVDRPHGCRCSPAQKWSNVAHDHAEQRAERAVDREPGDPPMILPQICKLSAFASPRLLI